MNKAALLTFACMVLPACAGMGLGLEEPKTVGEINTGYNYVPVDPLEVDVVPGTPIPAGASALQMRKLRYSRCVGRRDNGDPDKVDVMDALPDHTVRMAVRKTSGTGSGGFGPVAVSVSGERYQIIVDSIFADTTNVPLAIKIGNGGTSQKLMSLPENIPVEADIQVVRLKKVANDFYGLERAPDGFEEVTIPVYVGVGLRLTAHIDTNKGGVNLSNLTAVAANVEADRMSGALTMQSLGVFSAQVGSIFSFQSTLNTTSIQNALVGLGAVKAGIYDNDTGSRPRVTGIYNPLPTSDPELMNKIYSALARYPIPWSPCGSS